MMRTRGEVNGKGEVDNRVASVYRRLYIRQGAGVDDPPEAAGDSSNSRQGDGRDVHREMEQIRDFFNTDQDVRRYLLRIRRKTSLLIAVSCQLGALAADADRKVANSLYRFGYNVGMAFQIQDDLLDLCGTEKQIGKPPGSDMRQGILRFRLYSRSKIANGGSRCCKSWIGFMH